MSLPSLQSKPAPQLRPIGAITAATTLTAANSGTYYTVSQAAAYAITIPRASTCPGAYFRFTIIATGAFAITVSSGAAEMNLACISATGAAATNVVSNGGAVGTTLTFVATAGDGTWAEIYSDGTSWNGLAVSAVTGAKLTLA
jgi:hypothetical protein